MSISLARRIVAVFAAHAGSLILGTLVAVVVARWLTVGTPRGHAWFAYMAVHFGSVVVGAAVLVAVLSHWRTAERAGKPRWYQQWGLVRIAAICSALYAARLLVPALEPAPTRQVFTEADGLSPAVILAVEVTAALASLAIGWMWIWWCAVGPRFVRTSTGAAALLAALTWAAVGTVTPPLTVRWHLVYSDLPPGGGMAMRQAWRLGWSPASLASPSLATPTGWAFAVALLLSAAYVGWRRWIRPLAPAPV